MSGCLNGRWTTNPPNKDEITYLYSWFYSHFQNWFFFLCLRILYLFRTLSYFLSLLKSKISSFQEFIKLWQELLGLGLWRNFGGRLVDRLTSILASEKSPRKFKHCCIDLWILFRNRAEMSPPLPPPGLIDIALFCFRDFCTFVKLYIIGFVMNKIKFIPRHFVFLILINFYFLCSRSFCCICFLIHRQDFIFLLKFMKNPENFRMKKNQD